MQMFSIRTEFNQWRSDPDRMLLLRPTLLLLRKVQHLGQPLSYLLCGTTGEVGVVVHDASWRRNV